MVNGTSAQRRAYTEVPCAAGRSCPIEQCFYDLAGAPADGSRWPSWPAREVSGESITGGQLDERQGARRRGATARGDLHCVAPREVTAGPGGRPRTHTRSGGGTRQREGEDVTPRLTCRRSTLSGPPDPAASRRPARMPRPSGRGLTSRAADDRMAAKIPGAPPSFSTSPGGPGEPAAAGAARRTPRRTVHRRPERLEAVPLEPHRADGEAADQGVVDYFLIIGMAARRAAARVRRSHRRHDTSSRRRQERADSGGTIMTRRAARPRCAPRQHLAGCGRTRRC